MDETRNKINGNNFPTTEDVEKLLLPKQDFHVSAGFRDRLMKEVAKTEAKTSSAHNVTEEKGTQKRYRRFIPWIGTAAAVVATVITISVSLHRDDNLGEQTVGLLSETTQTSETLPEIDSDRTGLKPNDTLEKAESQTETLDEVKESSQSGLKIAKSVIADAKRMEKNYKEVEAAPKETGVKVIMELTDTSDEYIGMEPPAPAIYSEIPDEIHESFTNSAVAREPWLAFEHSESERIPMTSSDATTYIAMNSSNNCKFPDNNNQIYLLIKKIDAENEGYVFDIEDSGYYSEDEIAKIRKMERQEFVTRMSLEVEMAEAYIKQIQNTFIPLNP